MELSLKETVKRLAAEQVRHVIDSVELEIRQETGIHEIDLKSIIESIIADMIDPEGFTLDSYSRSPSIAKTQEQVAAEAIWRIYNPPIEKESYLDKIFGILDIIWPKWKEPPEIEVAIVEPLPPENLEVLKELVKKAALRKLKALEEKEKKQVKGKP